MARIYFISGPAAKVGAVTFNGVPITAASIPVLDGWGWADYWQCAEWMAWHQELRKVMTAEQAALKFIAEWNKQSADANPYNWCKYNSTFRNYMQSQGVNIDSILSAVIMPIFDATGNIAQGAGDVVTNVSNTASTISKLATPVVLLALAGAGVWAYKNYVK